MSQSKLTIVQKIADLSLNIKITLLLVFGVVLFFIKSFITSLLINQAIITSPDNIVAITASYHQWFNILFLVLFAAALYLGAFLQKNQMQRLNSNINQAITNNSLDSYASSLPKNQLNTAIRTLCQSAGESQKQLTKHAKEVAQLNEVTEHLIICMEIINDSMEEEFGQIEQLATAMNQMTATVREVASNASSASTATTEASKVAQEGSQFVDATIATINSLSSNIGASSDAVNSVELKVEGIGSVVDTIRSISEQTNLLALNAAIEAARAGEAGRGFAVVADEVRNLAKRTQDATVEIQRMIEQLQGSARAAVGLMDKSVKEADEGVNQITQAGATLAGIVEKVHHISDMSYQIASAADEQTTVAASINENLDQVKEVVEGSVTVLREVTEMAEAITKHAQALTKK